MLGLQSAYAYPPSPMRVQNSTQNWSRNVLPSGRCIHICQPPAISLQEGKISLLLVFASFLTAKPLVIQVMFATFPPFRWRGWLLSRVKLTWWNYYYPRSQPSWSQLWVGLLGVCRHIHCSKAHLHVSSVLGRLPPKSNQLFPSIMLSMTLGKECLDDVWGCFFLWLRS